MVAHDKFFEGPQAAAVLKHGVLGGYLTPFATKASTRSIDRRVWFIDAYAGPGRYMSQTGEGEVHPGSPLIAMRASSFLANIAAPRDLRCIFIERDRTHAASLEMLRIDEGFGDKHSVINGDAAANLQRAVATTGRDPLLTFLDPFGTSLPRAMMVDFLLKRNASAINEVLLNFHLSSVARIGASVCGAERLDSADEKTLARLESFVGAGWWRDTFTQYYRRGVPGSATEGALAVVAEFREQLRIETGYGSVAVDIRKGVEHAPIFQLILFSRHADGPYLFADAASSGNRKWRKAIREEELRRDAEEYRDTLFGDAFSSALFEDKWKMEEAGLSASWVGTIESNVIQLLEKNKAIVVADSISSILGTTFGLAGEKHLRLAWNNLAKQGHVMPMPSKSRPVRETICRPA